MLGGVDAGAVGHGAEDAVAGGQMGLRDALDHLLVVQPVGDDLGDADDVDAVPGGELLQLGHPGHGAVLVHDFADDAGGLQPGQLGQVHDGLRLAGAHEHAALLVAEGEQVAGARQLLRRGVRVEERLGGEGPVVGGDAGGGALEGIDGDGEGGEVAGGVVGDHHGQVQLLEPPGGEGHADEPAGVLAHEVDGLGRGELGADGQVALVLPVLVVDDDDELAGPDVFDCLLHGYQGHDCRPLFARRYPAAAAAPHTLP